MLDNRAAADEHGLHPQDYSHAWLKNQSDNLGNSANAQTIAALDVRLSYAFVDYAQDLHAGRIDPKAVDPNWSTQAKSDDYAKALRRAIENNAVAQVLAQMPPQQASYRRLQAALASYREQSKQGDWPAVPQGELIEPGDESPRVAALRKRLTASDELGAAAPVDSFTGNSDGDLADNNNVNTFDPALVEALRAFQRRHGLLVDGLLGDGAVAALNVSIKQRIREIEMNLERWRWLPSEFGERHVIVNVPDYSLTVFEQGTPQFSMGVIVGKQYDDQATPIFTDTMEHLVFRPYWGIPHSIAVEEIVPEARRDLGYLARKNYQIVPDYHADTQPLATTAANLEKVARGDLRLREKPGPTNSLGLVKFIFPNQYAVYLHDTPADHLFKKDKRAFSHGCVRVEKPAQLATWALSRQPAWDLARVESAMYESGHQKVELDAPIPVYILYWTAFVDKAGQVQFRPDLYGHDEKLAQALSRADS